VHGAHHLRLFEPPCCVRPPEQAQTMAPCATHPPPVQVVVICGRNQRLLDRLSMAPAPNGMPVKACGFVNNIHEWMGACDCIITKVGAGRAAVVWRRLCEQLHVP